MAEELVSAAQAADSAQAAIEATAAAEAQAQGAQQRLAACEELLGERDERLDEMRADLEDVRSLYKVRFEVHPDRTALAVLCSNLSADFCKRNAAR